MCIGVNSGAGPKIFWNGRLATAPKHQLNGPRKERQRLQHTCRLVSSSIGSCLTTQRMLCSGAMDWRVAEHQGTWYPATRALAALVAAGTQPYCQLEIQKLQLGNEYFREAVARSVGVKRQLPKATVPMIRGYFGEIHHVLTYNINAIKSGRPFRAYTIPGDGPADIEVLYHSAGQLHSEEVQVKMRRNPEDLRIAMSHPKYDNMQKVGPQDVPVDGVSDHISVGGVNSEPLSIKQGNAMVRDPAAHLMQYVPSRAWCVAQAAMWGATTGAMLGTAVALVPAWWDRERWGKQLAAQVAHNAWWGALTGGVASAVSVVSGSTVAGSVAAGAVGVWEAVRGAQDRTEAVREAVVLSTSFAAGLGAATLCTTVLGPAAFLAGPAAAWYASDYVRCTVKGHNPSLYQLAAWGLRARAAVQR